MPRILCTPCGFDPCHRLFACLSCPVMLAWLPGHPASAGTPSRPATFALMRIYIVLAHTRPHSPAAWMVCGALGQMSPYSPRYASQPFTKLLASCAMLSRYRILMCRVAPCCAAFRAEISRPDPAHRSSMDGVSLLDARGNSASICTAWPFGCVCAVAWLESGHVRARFDLMAQQRMHARSVTALAAAAVDLVVTGE